MKYNKQFILAIMVTLGVSHNYAQTKAKPGIDVSFMDKNVKPTEDFLVL